MPTEQQTTYSLVQIQVLLEKVENLEEKQSKSDAKIAKLEHEKDNALKWGITVLGSAILGLVIWVFPNLDKLK